MASLQFERVRSFPIRKQEGPHENLHTTEGGQIEGVRLFCLQLEAFCLQWGFLLTIGNCSVFAYNWSIFAYSFRFYTYSWSFFAYNSEVRLIRALRDCKQRSLAVSKKAPTASKKASPKLKGGPPDKPFERFESPLRPLRIRQNPPRSSASPLG